MKYLLPVAAAIVLSMHALAVDLAVTPTHLEVTATQGATTTVTVTVVSNGEKAQQIDLEVGDWDIDAEGNLHFLPDGSGPYSATPWVTPEAPAVTVPATGAQPVRFSVSVPDGTVGGTYWTMLFFRIAGGPELGQGLGVATTTRIGVALYVTVAGTEQPSAELVDLYGDPASRTVSAVVANTGNTVFRLSGKLEIRDDQGVVKASLPVPDTAVLRDGERDLNWTLPDDLETGSYVVLALIQPTGVPLLAGQTTVDLSP